MKKEQKNNNIVSQPVNLNSTKNKLKKFGKGCFFLASAFLAGLSSFPTKDAKSQEEIERSVELLNAEDSYYSLINTTVYDVAGKRLKEVKYDPLILPKNTKEVKVIVGNDFNDESKQAIKDSLTEYNSVLNAANQDWQFKFCGEYTLPDVADIVVSHGTSKFIGGMQLSAPLLNGSQAFNHIFIDKEYVDYHNVLTTFSHELMHYMGAGDLYTLSIEEQKAINSIMGVHSLTINVLKENDIKYLFATLDNVSTQADVERVNSYIDYHLTKFNYANKVSDNLKLKFGEEFLSSQVEQYTNESVTLNNINTTDMFLIDKLNSNNKPIINSSVKCVSVSDSFCSSFDIAKEKLSLKSESSRKFLDNNVVFDCGEYYAVFDTNGKLINLYESVSKEEFNLYYGRLYQAVERSRQENLTL